MQFHFQSIEDLDDNTVTNSTNSSDISNTEDVETHLEWVDGEHIDDIADFEDSLPYIECVHNQYYIGAFKYLEMQDILLFAKKIHISTFYKYSKTHITEYLYWFSGIYLCDHPHLDILQVKIDPSGIYSCVVKTFWLRIIQRRWKAVFHKEKTFYRKNILAILRTREKVYYSPFKSKLRGLLSHLSNVSK